MNIAHQLHWYGAMAKKQECGSDDR